MFIGGQRVILIQDGEIFSHNRVEVPFFVPQIAGLRREERKILLRSPLLRLRRTTENKNIMPEVPTLLEMLKSGVHFGHQTSRWHPKMKPYIFTQRNGIHIINLEETQAKLKEAVDFIRKTVQNGGVILFVGSKKQAQSIIERHAKDCGMPYVTERWLGGTMTNFSVILKLIRKLKDLKKKSEKGELEKYTKKEQLEFKREIEKLEKSIGGIQYMEKIPEAIFILDIKKEKTAFEEAKKRRIKIIAVCDTNVNPKDVDYIIPGNDDATKSIELIVGFISESIKEAKELSKAGEIEVDLR
jgi:small subunit ribosomal protein S2